MLDKGGFCVILKNKRLSKGLVQHVGFRRAIAAVMWVGCLAAQVRNPKVGGRGCVSVLKPSGEFLSPGFLS